MTQRRRLENTRPHPGMWARQILGEHMGRRIWTVEGPVTEDTQVGPFETLLVDASDGNDVHVPLPPPEEDMYCRIKRVSDHRFVTSGNITFSGPNNEMIDGKYTSGQIWTHGQCIEIGCDGENYHIVGQSEPGAYGG